MRILTDSTQPDYTWICEHSPDMWADRKNGQSLENDGVDGREDAVGVGEQDHPHHNKSANIGIFLQVLRIRILDPVPFWPMDPGSMTGKKSVSGSGMNKLDHISESLGTIFCIKILKYFVAGGSVTFWYRYRSADPCHWLTDPDLDPESGSWSGYCSFRQWHSRC